MLRIAFSLAAALVLVAALAAPARAASESTSCQTINGQTVCIHGSGANAVSSLNCQTVNGHTVCTGSNGLRCETVNGRLTCRGGTGSNVQILGTNSQPSSSPVDEEADED